MTNVSKNDCNNYACPCKLCKFDCEKCFKESSYYNNDQYSPKCAIMTAVYRCQNRDISK